MSNITPNNLYRYILDPIISSTINEFYEWRSNLSKTIRVQSQHLLAPIGDYFLVLGAFLSQSDHDLKIEMYKIDNMMTDKTIERIYNLTFGDDEFLKLSALYITKDTFILGEQTDDHLLLMGDIKQFRYRNEEYIQDFYNHLAHIYLKMRQSSNNLESHQKIAGVIRSRNLILAHELFKSLDND